MTDHTDDLVPQLIRARQQLEEIRNIAADGNTMVAFSDETYCSIMALLGSAADEIVQWRKTVADNLNRLDQHAEQLEQAKTLAQRTVKALQKLADAHHQQRSTIQQLCDICQTFADHARPLDQAGEHEIAWAQHQLATITATISGKHV
jgi:DNA repair ATPase RecN